MILLFLENNYIDQVTDFTGTDLAQLKNEFRTAMNEIAEKMSIEEQDAFIEESNNVFLLNNSIVKSVRGQNEVLRNILYKVSIVTCFIIGIVVAMKWHK